MMPRSPDHDLATAAAYLDGGNPDQADALCRRALKTRRKSADAWFLFARIQEARGRWEEAARAVGKSLQLDPRGAEAHLLLAKLRIDQGRYDEAYSRYEKLLRLEPGHPAATRGKAEILNRRRRYAEAKAMLEPAVEAGPTDAGTAIVFVRAATGTGDYEDAIETAHAHLAGVDMADHLRRTLLFMLATACERADRCDEAFAHYAEANRIRPGRYDHATERARVDRCIEVFTRERLAAAPKPSPTADRAVFVVGRPRSGSTLIEQIIDAHPQAAGAGELAALLELINSMSRRISSTLRYPECVADLDGSDVNRLSRSYLDTLKRAGRGARRVVDKQLANTYQLGLIQILFPGARVIHSRRDPVNTCLSCFTQDLDTDHHPWASDLESLAASHLEHERLMRHWSRTLDLPLLEVDYERLVAEPEPEGRRIIEFCGLPWDEACLRFFETGRVAVTLSTEQVAQPIYTTSADRAARFGHHLDPLRRALDL